MTDRLDMHVDEGTRNAKESNADRQSLVVCIAEDRRAYEGAVRLLIASLSHHCPAVPVQLFIPDTSPQFRQWMKKYPVATLNMRRIDDHTAGYDVKPQALIGLLECGFEQVLWIDSDILVLSDFMPRLGNLSPEVFVAAEEALCSSHGDPDALRARLWGFEVGRRLPFAANSGVIRATRVHLQLLRCWRELLRKPAYREAQQRPWRERPLHLMGDQEVLTALLASSEFAHIPIEFLRRGTGIVQYFGSTGYTVAERLRALVYSSSLFFHAQGPKPWWPPPAHARGLSLSDRFNRLYQEVTPYIMLAEPYRAELESDDWLAPRSRAGRLLSRLAFGQPALFGMPLALIADAVRMAKRLGSAIKHSDKT